jgi:hypothetical protein
MITRNKTGKIKKNILIKIFNLVRQDIYSIVFAKFIYKNYFLFNQIIIVTDTHIKLMNKKNYVRLHILEILSENKFFYFKNKIHLYKR